MAKIFPELKTKKLRQPKKKKSTRDVGKEVG